MYKSQFREESDSEEAKELKIRTIRDTISKLQSEMDELDYKIDKETDSEKLEALEDSLQAKRDNLRDIQDALDELESNIQKEKKYGKNKKSKA